jgi:NitT/TauT family transport system substrate-binding protein
VEDLKGKVIGTNLKGSGVDIAMRAMLRKHHLDETKDVTIIEAATSTQPAMLMGHKVDIIPGVLPFSMDATVRDAARALFLQRDAMGITQMGMWVARAGFIEKNRAALVDFIEDALRAERWYLDPANHDEAVAIAVKVTKAPPERWQSWLFEKHGEGGDYYRDPNGIPNIDALQSNIETVRDLGFIKSSIDVKKYVDLSLVEEATRRLK